MSDAQCPHGGVRVAPLPAVAGTPGWPLHGRPPRFGGRLTRTQVCGATGRTLADSPEWPAGRLARGEPPDPVILIAQAL